MNWYDHYDKDTDTLTIPSNFGKKLVNLPPQTKIMTFVNKHAYRLCGIFNKSVGHEGCIDERCPRNLPSGLTHLTFGYYFNQTVNRLPSNLIYLKFDYMFNRKVNMLPNTLTHLTLGTNFNQSIENLPSSLTHLTFGFMFNQSVEKLPSSLTDLTFGYMFNQNIDKLPTNLKCLSFPPHFNKINDIPEHIDNIQILFHSKENLNIVIDNLPSHIKKIKINMTDKLYFITKIPFGCKIFDDNDKEIFLI